MFLFTHCAPDEEFDDAIDPIVDTPDNNNGPGEGNNGNNNGNNPPNNNNITALPQQVLDPADNPSSPAKIALGRALFWDPLLSGEKDVACATCHHPRFGYSDGRQLPIGTGGVGLGPNRRQTLNDVGVVPRNSPTIINSAFNGINQQGQYFPETAAMFWDNRAASLEEQALKPLESFEEMRGHAFNANIAVDSIVARIQSNAEYRTLFQNAFGGGNAVTSTNIAKAISAFERNVVAFNSPFDEFARGNTNALNNQEQRGLAAFQRAGCDDCHSGPMFSDFELHVLAVPDHPLLDNPDSGANGSFAFRTPTLRNLEVTGPYFHNGVAGSLNQVLNFYRTIQGNGGGGNNGLRPNPNVNQNQLDPDIRDLRLNNNDIQDIIAFIETLNDDSFDDRIPDRVPSGLRVGGN